MGGAVREGNWTPAAEFNIWVDPEAARIVFRSGLPITMVGLDVTHQAHLPRHRGRPARRARDAGRARVRRPAPVLRPVPPRALRLGRVADPRRRRRRPRRRPGPRDDGAVPGRRRDDGRDHPRPDRRGHAWRRRPAAERRRRARASTGSGSSACWSTRSPRSGERADRRARPSGQPTSCATSPSATRTRSAPRWPRATPGRTSSSRGSPRIRRRTLAPARRQPRGQRVERGRRRARAAAAARRRRPGRVRVAARRRQRRRPGRARSPRSAPTSRRSSTRCWRAWPAGPDPRRRDARLHRDADGRRVRRSGGAQRRRSSGSTRVLAGLCADRGIRFVDGILAISRDAARGSGRSSRPTACTRRPPSTGGGSDERIEPAVRGLLARD